MSVAITFSCVGTMKKEFYMRFQLPMRLTQFTFSLAKSMSKFTVAVLFCAFALQPVFAEENLEWRYHGNDLYNQNFQDVDQINPRNVSKLKPAWIFHTGVFDPNM
jgi:glucose dehydrogenase